MEEFASASIALLTAHYLPAVLVRKPLYNPPDSADAQWIST
jgi:hypothetical protein